MPTSKAKRPVGKIRVKTCHIAVFVLFWTQLRSGFGVALLWFPVLKLWAPHDIHTRASNLSRAT